jgi:hypothetical protein
MFTALTLFVGIVVVATVGYAIYEQPREPKFIGTVTGKPHTKFSGTVGTLMDEHEVSGYTPFQLKVGYRQADEVFAVVRSNTGAVNAAIRVERKVVDEGTGQQRGSGGRTGALVAPHVWGIAPAR